MNNIKMTVTKSKNTMTTKWLIGRSYGYLSARPEAAYDASIVGAPIASVDVTHEDMFAGTQDEWTLSIAGRVESAFEALNS